MRAGYARGGAVPHQPNHHPLHHRQPTQRPTPNQSPSFQSPKSQFRQHPNQTTVPPQQPPTNAPFAARKGRERAQRCERGMPGAARGTPTKPPPIPSTPTHPTTNTQSKPIIPITKITVQTTHQPNHRSTPTAINKRPFRSAKGARASEAQRTVTRAGYARGGAGPHQPNNHHAYNR